MGLVESDTIRQSELRAEWAVGNVASRVGVELGVHPLCATGVVRIGFELTQSKACSDTIDGVSLAECRAGVNRGGRCGGCRVRDDCDRTHLDILKVERWFQCMASETLSFIVSAIVIGALWVVAQTFTRRFGSANVDDLLSTRAIAQTIATQQEKIDTLNQEVLQMQRVIVDLQARLERATETVKRLELDLKRMTEERDILQRMARGVNISDSTINAQGITGGDVSVGHDQTHDQTQEHKGEHKEK